MMGEQKRNTCRGIAVDAVLHVCVVDFRILEKRRTFGLFW